MSKNTVNADFKYSKEHEWVEKLDNGNARVGITDYAQKSLGDVVYVDLPSEGNGVHAGDSVGTVESVKAVSDIYCPVSGDVVKINEQIADHPELVNKDPYADGWLFEIKMSDIAEMDSLMSAEDYSQFTVQLSE